MIDRRLIVSLGILATILATALWHGPAGTAERFSGTIEQTARRTLDYYELPKVSARLERAPLGRRMLLSGPADDFQRSELVRIMRDIPGVSEAGWSTDRRTVPLLLEAAALALIAFGLGLLLAYLVELRRRARAEWRW